MKRIILLVCVVLILLMFTGCKKGSYALIKTNQGDILVQLTPETTPETVANFIGLAEGTKEWTDPKSGQKVKKPFYDGLIFHRVINDFMIQGAVLLEQEQADPDTSLKMNAMNRVKKSQELLIPKKKQEQYFLRF